MPGTVRKIIERIKEKRSGGNSVVALTVETRLVLQGFDPQRFEYDTPDDAGRLARIRDIAREMQVDVSDLLQAADVEPDANAAPAPAPESPGGGEAAEKARAAAASAAASSSPAAPVPSAGARAAASPIPSDHPLRRFLEVADATLSEVGAGPDGASSGTSFGVLLKASALMALYSISKDSVFCDVLRHDTLFQWFLGLEPEQARFAADTFSADREKALASDQGRAFFDRLVPAAGREKLFSQPVFQVDSSALKAWMTQRGARA